jgi:hypothetical protein
MICRGVLLPVSFVADINNGKKATPAVAIKFRKICGNVPLGLFTCKIQEVGFNYFTLARDRETLTAILEFMPHR